MALNDSGGTANFCELPAADAAAKRLTGGATIGGEIFGAVIDGGTSDGETIVGGTIVGIAC